MQSTTNKLPPGKHGCDAEDLSRLYCVCSTLPVTVTAENNMYRWRQVSGLWGLATGWHAATSASEQPVSGLEESSDKRVAMRFQTNRSMLLFTSGDGSCSSMVLKSNFCELLSKLQIHIGTSLAH